MNDTTIKDLNKKIDLLWKLYYFLKFNQPKSRLGQSNNLNARKEVLGKINLLNLKVKALLQEEKYETYALDYCEDERRAYDSI